MNIYAKFQLHPPYGFWEEDFFFFFFFFFFFCRKFSLSPIKISDSDETHIVIRGLLQEHFCKTFVKITAVTQK